MTTSDSRLLEEARRLDHMGQHGPALLAFERYLERQPNDAGAWADYGGLLMDLGRWEDSGKACERSLRADKDHYVGLVHSACVLMHLGEPEQAEPILRHALSTDPSRLGARLTLSDCLVQLKRVDQARLLLDQILVEKPGNPAALNRLSTLFVLQGDWANLRKDLERQLPPDSSPEADYRRSHLSLLFGEMPSGWDQFESRLQIPGRVLAERRFPQPRWDGGSFVGKSLLINWEQGYGDTIMFLRFVPMVKALGGKVMVEVQPPLADLVATCPGIDQVIADGSPLPHFDLHVPLLSLPSVFQTVPASIPSEIPYLDIPSVVPNRERIAAALAPSLGRLRVGVAWAGNPTHQRDTKRSMPSTALAPLSDWKGVAWHSFQLAKEELPPLPGIISLAPLLSNFSDTAYALSGMDLVITVDTALAHLAGALGIPTFLLISFIPDWRWLLGRTDSPWYPTIRLFRQTAPSDWASAIRDLASQLADPA